MLLVTEGQQEEEDFTFFRYDIGDYEEWGYISLSELQSSNVRSLTVKRDLYFKQGKMSEV